MSASADRNLLFGILAVQLDFISKDALIAAMNAWLLDKSRPLGDILREQGQLSAERLHLLAALVAEHLKQHGDDPQKSLAALSSVEPFLKKQLAALPDAAVQASLVRVAIGHAAASDSNATIAQPQPILPTAGRYRILRPHAKGGLGEVFVAEDTELGRQIALKEIQAQHADRTEHRQRFILEAEITGGLEHPGIVPVYGLGTYADGRPFYAMRFIKGDNLRDEIRRFHGTNSTSDKRRFESLAFRELLGRFVDVCQAVAYAHSRGVLHRDLKPGNVMLGQYGETLVVDWGLAKPIGHDGDHEQPDPRGESTLKPRSVSESSPTVIGQALGTPAYMPPEQADGRLDQIGPMSDVYSLGATLYELLTGRPPFAGTTDKVLAEVRRGGVAPPRTVNPALPRPLEAMCLKAMARRPADRYATAQALASDVERWLADEPASAWKEPVGMRLRRWVRRHRTLVTTGIVAGLLLVAAGVTGLMLWDAADRRHALQVQAHRADLRRGAEVSEQLGLSELHAGRFALAADFFGRSAETIRAEASLADLYNRLEARRGRAARLAEFYRLSREAEDIQRDDQDDAAAEQFAAATRVLDLFAAEDWWNRLPADDLTPRQQERLRRDVQFHLIHVVGTHGLKGLITLGKPAVAAAANRAALQAAEAAQRYQRTWCGDFAVKYLRSVLNLAKQSDLTPADTEVKSHIDHYILGMLHVWVGQLPDDPISRLFLNPLGSLQLDLKAPLATAEQHLRQAASLDPEHYLTYHWLGYTLAAAKKYDAAELAYSADVGLRPDDATGYFQRGIVALRQLSDADPPTRRRQILSRATADFETAVRLAPTKHHVYYCRAMGHQAAGRLNDAVTDLTTALRLQSADHPYRSQYHRNRGNIYGQMKQFADAERDLNLAIKLCPKTIRLSARFDVAEYYTDRASLNRVQGKSDAAIADFSAALRVKSTPARLTNRADAYLRSGAYAQCIEDCTAALRNDTKYARAYDLRARSAVALGRHNEALSDWDRAIEYDDGSSRGPRLLGRAGCLARTGQAAKAVDEVDAALPQLKGADDVLDAARVYAVAASNNYAPTADRYGARAVVLLRQAIDRGYSDLAHFRKDPDLDPVRSRPDYIDLLWDLAERQVPDK